MFRERDVVLGHVLMIEEKETLDEKEIEDDTHGLHRVVNHGSQHVKKKNVANQEAVQEVVNDAMEHHHVVIVKRNVKKNQKNGDVKKNTVVVDQKRRHVNRNEYLKKNRAHVTMMLKNELVQRIHQNVNHRMMLPKKIWILQILHRFNNF